MTSTPEFGVGIDLGTTSSCVSIFQDGKAVVISRQPSCFFFGTSGSVILRGQEAQTAAQAPDANLSNYVFDPKRLLGLRTSSWMFKRHRCAFVFAIPYHRDGQGRVRVRLPAHLLRHVASFAFPTATYNQGRQKDALKNWPYDWVDGGGGMAAIQIKPGSNHDEHVSGSKTFLPVELVAMQISMMKDIAENHLKGAKVTSIVLTCPMYYGQLQRHPLYDACAIAGVTCLRAPPAPTVASYSLNVIYPTVTLENILFVDVGDGSVEVSLQVHDDGIYEERATSGLEWRGKEDIVHCMANFCVEKFRTQHPDLVEDPTTCFWSMRLLREACAETKRKFCTSINTLVPLEHIVHDIHVPGFFQDNDLVVRMNRAQFDAIIEETVRKCLRVVDDVLKDGHIAVHQMNQVVVLGGGGRVPAFVASLRHYFASAHNCNPFILPGEPAACGAAMLAAILIGDQDPYLDDLLLLEVTHCDLGVRCGMEVTCLVKRGSTVPTRKTNVVKVAGDGVVQVVERSSGGEPWVKIGEMHLDPFVRVEITIEMDVKNIAFVNAADLNSRKILSRCDFR